MTLANASGRGTTDTVDSSDPVVHTRDIRVDGQASVISVIDEIAARSAHAIERFWHFADDCVVQIVGDAKIIA